ncbi:hypothetical protein ANCCAN_03668 [Ancylostoma caninum]|uniref:Uncharacterized protein n=1 Tax=Ancylostoma caninum TaxID=29170 RepID=A0A368H0U0_ANCCA|nr:hypothetical protein ANCCAN_03668 [Ancylostoma caninum]
MVGWTPSSEPARDLTERRAPAKFKLPVPVLVEDEVPPSPRERMPHRSAGYGPAHQKRKLSIPDRSRSASPMRQESPIPTYDRYAKYERNRTGDELQMSVTAKNSMTRYGTKWGADAARSGAPSPKKESADSRPPHRTPALSPRIPSSITPFAHDAGGFLYSGRGKTIPPYPQPSTCTLIHAGLDRVGPEKRCSISFPLV